MQNNNNILIHVYTYKYMSNIIFIIKYKNICNIFINRCVYFLYITLIFFLTAKSSDSLADIEASQIESEISLPYLIFPCLIFR